MRSMTGFGRGSGRSKAVHLTAEIKTVNHKFHDVTIKLPGVCQFLEPEIRDWVLGSVTRGKVDVYVRDQTPGGGRRVTVQEEILEGYLKAARGAARKFKLKGDIPAEAVLRLPDVLRVSEEERPEADLRKAARQAMTVALQALDKMRFSEGGRLAKDVIARAAETHRLIGLIRERHKALMTEKVKALREKVAEFLPESLQDQARLATEEGILLQRHDIAEELTRLSSHVEALLGAVKEKGVVGRRLDFLLQEMNREANTIGSKSSDASLAHHVVRLKEVLEQVREQIQNIE